MQHMVEAQTTIGAVGSSAWFGGGEIQGID
jgi:hypothetical protein